MGEVGASATRPSVLGGAQAVVERKGRAQRRAPSVAQPRGEERAGAWWATLTSNGAILALRVVSGVLCARLLGVAGRGALASVRFWPDLLANLGLLSLHEGITYRTARAGPAAATVRASGLFAALLLAAAVLLGGLLCLPSLLGSERSGLVALGRLYLVALVPAQFLLASLMASDLGAGRFGRYNALRILPFLGFAAGLVALGATGRLTLETALWASLAGTSLAAAIRLWMWWREPRAKPCRGETKTLLRLSLRFHAASVLSILSAHVDRLVVIALWSDSAVGLYVVAWTVATTGQALLTRTFHTVLFPRIAAETRPEEQRRLLAAALRRSMLLLCVGVVFLAALTPWLVPFLFGHAFDAARWTTIVLLFAYLPAGLRQIIVRGLRGLGRARPGTIAESIALAVFVAAVWPLGRALQLPGVAIALGAANVAALAYLAVDLKRNLKIGLREWWGLDRATVAEGLRVARASVRRVVARSRRRR